MQKANQEGRPLDELSNDRRHYTDDLRPKLRGRAARQERDRGGKRRRDREQDLRRRGFSEHDRDEKQARLARRAREERSGERRSRELEKLRHGSAKTKQARRDLLRQEQQADRQTQSE